MWNLEGRRVTGRTLHNELITGIVEMSRVAYGGQVKHYVKLDQPVQRKYRELPSQHMIITHSNVVNVEQAV